MIEAGQVFETLRRFSQDDFDRFARLSGDDNPIHVDPAFAAGTHFGHTVAHGMLLYSALSAALDAHIPGNRQLEHEMMFPSGTPAGEEVRIRIAVDSVDPRSGEAVLEVAVLRPGGDIGLRGHTRVRLPEPRS